MQLLIQQKQQDILQKIDAPNNVHRVFIRALMLTIIIITLCLSACSKSPDHADIASETTDTANSASAKVEGMDESTQDADLKQADTAQDVPTTLVSEQVNPVEKARKMVKTAAVDFEVKDVYQTGLALEQLTVQFAGFVEQKDIEKQQIEQFSRRNTDGSQTIFSKIQPRASMVVRIPSAHTQRFINSLPKFMLFLNEQRYEAKRLELRLLQEKLNQQANSADASNTQASNRLTADIARLTQQEVEDRLNYSTIQLTFSQAATLHQVKDIQLKVLAKQQDNFFVRVWQSIYQGAVGFLDFIVVAIVLWPLWLILLIGGGIVWKYKKRRAALQRGGYSRPNADSSNPSNNTFNNNTDI